MMDDLMRDLQVLWKADSLIGRIWLNVLARRLALSMFAALIAVFGLGMANVAGFYGLQPSYGFVGSAAIVALVDFVLAALVLWLASRAQPGTELELALEVRKMAIASLQSDTADVRVAVELDPPGHPANQGQHCGLRPKSTERGGRKAPCSGGAVAVERPALEDGEDLSPMAAPPEAVSRASHRVRQGIGARNIFIKWRRIDNCLQKSEGGVRLVSMLNRTPATSTAMIQRSPSRPSDRSLPALATQAEGKAPPKNKNRPASLATH